MDQVQLHIDELQSLDPAIRERAAQALHNLGDAARPAIPALLSALIREPDACPWVGTALTTLGPSAADVDAIREALHSDNSHVRFWATRAAVKLRSAALPLVDDLISLLCDARQSVVDSVVWALGEIGPDAIPPLIDAASSDDPELRGRAILALGRYARDADRKLPTILNGLDDPDRDVRNCASRALCSLGQSAHLDPEIYDSDTLSSLLSALDRLADDDSIDVDIEWLNRIRGWLGPRG